VRTRLFVGEAFRSVTANLSTTIAATMTVLIGMFLLGLFIALGTWVLSWTDEVKKDVIVRVFFDQNATNRQIEAVRADLVGRPDVAKVVFVSKEDALRRMREKHPELVKNLASNPLPASYEVTPKRAEQVEAVAGSLDPLPRGVEKVNYGKKTTDRILQVAKIIGGIFLVGSLILLTASTLLIANTIRLSIFSRRREVEVMKLVGATNWFVRGPFMLEGIICGLVGSAVAVTLLLMAKEFALPSILGRIDEPGDGVNAISFPLMAFILVGTSLLVGALGSGITLRRFLKV
jgi:cell division transport system permease protein